MEKHIRTAVADTFRHSQAKHSSHPVEKLVDRALVVTLQHKRALVSLHENYPSFSMRRDL